LIEGRRFEHGERGGDPLMARRVGMQAVDTRKPGEGSNGGLGEFDEVAPLAADA
jgi:hypothetical protein